MKLSFWIPVLALIAASALCASGPAAASGRNEDGGTAPAYVKKSATEEKAVTSAAPGVNVRGESGGFDDYLNDDLFPEDEEVRLMEVDPNSRVVLGGAEDTAGVSFKKSYEKSPVAE